MNLSPRWRRLIGNDVPIPRPDLTALMEKVFEHETAFVTEADSLVPDISHYVSSYMLEAFVRGDLTIEHVRSVVKLKRAFHSRMLELLPGLLRHLSFGDDQELYGALSLIDDCHTAFSLIARSPRQDKQRREQLLALGAARDAVRRAVLKLAAVRHQIEAEFETAHRVANRSWERQDLANRRLFEFRFDRFLQDLRTCNNSVEIAIHRAKSEPKYLQIISGQLKTNIVEAAHHLCCAWNGPSLTTTPGSSFSAFASLLYETISGEPDVSLAGAINRYAKSPERFEFEQMEAEFGPGYIESAESNNFSDQDRRADLATKKIELYNTISKSSDLLEDAKILAMRIAVDAGEDLVEILREYGPFEVWAKPRNLEEVRRSAEMQREAIARDIEIGRLKRSKRINVNPMPRPPNTSTGEA